MNRPRNRDGEVETAAPPSLAAAALLLLLATGSPAPAAPVVGQSVTLTDTSTGEVSARSWHFGDGATSSDAGTTRTFTTPGSTWVGLTVTGAGDGTVVCVFGALAAGATASAAVVVSAPASGPRSATAELLSAQPETAPGDNAVTETTGVGREVRRVRGRVHP